MTLDDIIGSTLTIVENGETRRDAVVGDHIKETEFGYWVYDIALMVATMQGTFNMKSDNVSIPETGIYFLSAGGTAYISSLSNITVHSFDDKYIPDSIARKAELDSRITEKEVILTSSTTDSTKKFKITVNDSGTLTATAITK